LPFQNRLKSQKANYHVRNALNLPTSCENLVRFGQLSRVLIAHFCTREKLAKIGMSDRTYLTDLNQIFSFGKHVGGDD